MPERDGLARVTERYARRKTRQLNVGSVAVGGDAPISIQSMTTTKTDDVEATLIQVHELATQGADIVRVAVPHEADARALPLIVQEGGVPIIADIHFSVRLALMAIEAGVHGLRLNPGNMRNPKHIKEVADAARERNIPIRIGVNAGSLDRKLVAKYGRPTAEALAESAVYEIGLLEEHGFRDIKVSVKHQNVSEMIAAYRLLADKTDAPFHLGVTEAGTPKQGIVKSAIGIGTLLAEGIGDTIRVSLTAESVEEVKVGKQILSALGIRQEGFDLVACPSCGRAELDVFALAEEVERRIEKMDLPPMQIAVMGCEVNGPGEARDADIGIAAGPGRGLLFSKGEQIGWVPHDRLVEALLVEAERVADEIRASGAAGDGGVTVTKGAGRRIPTMTIGMGPAPD
ncbi:MAG: flavodoxin-dependent (E)-4-hydroxy-3-methylbut-2-enyl-diphosphate synthase [Actinobacteria bacterium]|nr:flavodoxin-dependent (E)-4-hydroxy-3-methylbut-2-enyl-diphosphate synthase [Actinomycetota bacterium]